MCSEPVANGGLQPKHKRDGTGKHKDPGSIKIEGPQQIIMAVQMSSAAVNETGGAKKDLRAHSNKTGGAHAKGSTI